MGSLPRRGICLGTSGGRKGDGAGTEDRAITPRAASLNWPNGETIANGCSAGARASGIRAASAYYAVRRIRNVVPAPRELDLTKSFPR
jgi:hypothetical protein